MTQTVPGQSNRGDHHEPPDLFHSVEASSDQALLLHLPSGASSLTRALLALLLLVLTATPAAAHDGCEPERASQWAPAGFVCPPHYGVGDASVWDGPGSASNSCTFPWRDCQTVAVQSLRTGLTIVTTPSTWCHCWVRVTGPQGETERLIDLDPDMVRALGHDPFEGLIRVRVTPVDQRTGLPDTAVAQ